MIICGARPEIIKLAPLYLLLKSSSLFKVKLSLTGQHPDLIPPLLKTLKITSHETIISSWKGLTEAQILKKLKTHLPPKIENFGPDLIIVHGDTYSSLFAATISAKIKIPVAHIEAGLRTFDIKSPFPEEANRQTISKLSKWHFCPTEKAKKNLLNENIDPKDIFVTGNTAIDTLKSILLKISMSKENSHNHHQKPYILITLHRRESHGSPLREILKTIAEISSLYPKYDFILPVHPNPIVGAAIASILTGFPNIKLTKALLYPDFIQLMKNAYFIMSDSGGLQEEAPFLNIPLLILREKTERMEAVETGAIRIAGTSRPKILTEVSLLMHDQKHYKEMCQALNPFGEGDASEKIINHLSEIL
jgi:UDP-N-acetylglucosamine 2-epimerase (non-hydrolysing)